MGILANSAHGPGRADVPIQLIQGRGWGPLSAMRAAFGVNACVGQPQPLHWLSFHQMLFHNVRGIGWLHMAIPDGFRVNHDHRAVFALVQAERLVDPDSGTESSGLGQLLQLGVQFRFTVSRAGWAGCVGGTDVVTDKYMMFKGRQMCSSQGILDAQDESVPLQTNGSGRMAAGEAGQVSTIRSLWDWIHRTQPISICENRG